MRILYISAEPIRLRHASETHINEIASRLRRAGHTVVIHATQSAGSYDKSSLPHRCLAYLGFWLRVLLLLRRADIIYARSHPANFPIALVARLMRIPVAHEINGSYYDISITHEWLRPWNNAIAALLRWQYRKADVLIAVTPGLANWVKTEVPDVAVETVPNGANCEIFRPDLPSVRPVDGDYALFFGSMTRWHGIENLIAAAHHPAWPADLHLVLVGEGQLAPAAADNPGCGSESKIHYVASVPQPTLASYIGGACMGLVPSNSIGNRGELGLSPLKLYEMLACGLPVVVTDFPVQADLVRALGAGLVVPPDSPEAIARAVAALRTNPPARAKMLQVASAIRTDHDWDNRSHRIAEMLSQIKRRG